MARVTPDDFVIDLGSGDGRNVIAAARRGAQALGVEYNPGLVELSKQKAAEAGVAGRAQFVRGDMFLADISRATALVLFLIPSNLEKLMPKFLELAPGTRIVSNTYEIGGGWQPDETDGVTPCATWCVAYLYIVPARVAGTWRMPQGELTTFAEIRQKYFGAQKPAMTVVWVAGLATLAVVLTEYCGYRGRTRMSRHPAAASLSRALATEGLP